MVNGKTNALCVEPSQTVFSVKRAMEELTGVQTSKQKLVFNGRELGDDQATLSTCGVKSYSKLILAPLLPPGPSTAAAAVSTPTGILVKTLSGKSIHVQASLSDTVEEICTKIQRTEGIALEQLQLIYGGKVLEWDVPLKGYNIQEGSALHMVCTSSQRRVLIRIPPAMAASSLSSSAGPGGSHRLVSMAVMLSDTVETLRGKVVAKFKLPTPEQQELYFEGVHLEAGRELRDYPIKTNSIIDIQLHNSSSNSSNSNSSHEESLSQDLFVRTPWGKVVTVPFLPGSDTVRSIKEKVHAKTGMALESQVLLLAGNPLGDAMRLSSCNISTESSFQLVLRENGEEEEGKEDPVQIFVRTMMGETFALDAFPSDTVRGVKAKIRDRKGLPVSRQSLLMRGEPLADSVKLRDCNIDTESTFYLTLTSGTPAEDDSDPSDASPDSAPEVIFIRNLLGKSISIEILPTDRVKDLKERIFAKEGIRVEEQNLVFHGNSLGDEELIKHHNIDQESNLQLALISSEKRKSLNTPASFTSTPTTMVVKYLKRTIPLSINLDGKIAEAKAKICEKEGISPSRQRLLYQGRELEDGRSFADYRINQRSTLVLVLRGSHKSCKANVQLPSGKISSVGFDPGDTVASLKHALQHSERVPVSRQSILDKHGSVLHNEVEISSHAASGSVVLSMVVSPIRTVSVLVSKSLPNSRPRVISLDNVATVDDLRAKVVASLVNLPATSTLNFFHEGKHLADDFSHILEEGSLVMLGK